MYNRAGWLAFLSLVAHFVARAEGVTSDIMWRLRRSGAAFAGYQHCRLATAFVHRRTLMRPQLSCTGVASGMVSHRGGSHCISKFRPVCAASKHFMLSAGPLRASLTTLESLNVQGDGPAPPFTDELNPSQKEATLRPRYSITRVIAGPGAGKTKVLTCRIAHLLLDRSHFDADQTTNYSNSWSDGNREGILAVTFTKKAAMEMERRLTDLLASAVTQEDKSDADTTASIYTGDDEMMEEGEFVQYGNADPTDAGGDVENKSRQLMRRTTVGTFHSVCSKILRKFGRELGDLPSVRSCLGVANASGATVVQDGVQSGFSGEDGSANSGVLVQTLDGSFNILDQSDQLRLLKEVLQKHNIQLKSESGASGGSNSDIRPITVLNAISLLNTNDALKSTSTAGGDEDLSGKISRKVQKIATEIRVSFQREKYAQNSIDFDDLILLTRELLLHHPEVREALHRRWRHILVDEFQDTSQVQLDLVRLLTTNSLFVVGDGDQSIYSWRGASPESMTDFELAFHGRAHGWEGLLSNSVESLSQYLEQIGTNGNHGPRDSPLEVQSVYLMENYRSTTNIVKAAQRIISAPENSGKDNPASAQDSIRRDMKPMRGTGPSPRVLACKDAKAEAKFVVKTVNSMVNSGDITPSSTVAMIYRTNAQSRLLEEACVEHNLRYVVRGSSGTFYKRAEIQDCMAFLKIMYNARDRSAWARAVKAPSRGIGETSLNEFFRYCDAVTAKCLESASGNSEIPTPLDVMISFAQGNDGVGMPVPPKEVVSTRSMNRFIPFASALRSLRRKAEVLPVSDFLLSVIDDLGLKGHFDAISKTRDEYEDRLGNVMELVRAAERYKEDGPCISPTDEGAPMDTPLGNFLDDVALIADLSPDEEADMDDSGGRVVANLMTIHSSKGMEFDAVFLVGNEEGTFPTQKAISEGESSIELSEERRLCYVAMTRAKTHLVLTWRREVSYFAGAAFKSRDADRSRFLDLLVGKQGGKPGKVGQKMPRKSSFNSSGKLGSVTKRELHSEADRWLSSTNDIGRNTNSQTVSKEGLSGRKTSGRKKTIISNGIMGSMSRSDLEAQADRYLASGVRSVGNRNNFEPTPQKSTRGERSVNVNQMSSANKSWDDWEPSSQRKTVEQNPSIQSNRLVGGIDRRQVMPSPRTQKRSVYASSDKRQEIPLRRRSVDGRQKGSSTLADVGKRRQYASDNAEAFRGEAPPDSMDSTLFFPVGSSVKHRLHGRGIVQNPPRSDAEFAEKMLVRVKFAEAEGSIEWDLPMDGLVHTYE